jgi:hypothetical protein
MIAVRHLPSWLPGAGFRRSAVEWKKLIEDFVNEPYEDCKQKIVSRLPFPRSRANTSSDDTEKWNCGSIFHLACI